jgi:hypothetical protein
VRFSDAQLEEFRDLADRAIRAELGRPATPWERQVIMAQAWLETSFGRGWKGVCASSHNWGGVQSKTPTCCWSTDRRQNGTQYRVHFACYDDDLGGARGLVKEALRRRKGTVEAIAAGDLGLYAELLHDQWYFGGICGPWPVGSAACRSKVIRDYAGGLKAGTDHIARVFKETPIPMGTLPPEPASLGTGGTATMAGFGLVALGALGIFGLTLASRRVKR